MAPTNSTKTSMRQSTSEEHVHAHGPPQDKGKESAVTGGSSGGHSGGSGGGRGGPADRGGRGITSRGGRSPLSSRHGLDDTTSRAATKGATPNITKIQPSRSVITKMPMLASGLALALACVYASVRATTQSAEAFMPASANDSRQIQFVNPLGFAVLNPTEPNNFRENAITQLFNPTNTTPPFFQAFHPNFFTILGDQPTIRRIAFNPAFAFAHEAPIWFPDTDEVTFASNNGGALGMSDINNNNMVAKISLKEVAAAIRNSGKGVQPVNVTVTKLDIPDAVQMTNGGTGPLDGSLLLANSGRGPLPPSITLSSPKPPFTTKILLDNFFGRQFNSLNDIKIHPTSKKLFFTDAPYGFLNGFRPRPLLPNQVYRFDQDTGSVRVVADGFDKSNGIAFSQDGKTAYVTDTGLQGGSLGVDQTAPATIYAFDVDPKTQTFTNRRVFAFADTGIPDGLQLDTKGNVYSGCGDGVQVWDSTGTLLGKFFVGTTSANMVFAGKGRLVILAETAVYLAEIAAEGVNLAF